MAVTIPHELAERPNTCAFAAARAHELDWCAHTDPNCNLQPSLERHFGQLYFAAEHM